VKQRWNYKEITDCVEKEIKHLLDVAHGKTGDEAEFRRQWAYGVYLMWEMLTVGHCDPLDDVRLQALVNDMEGREEDVDREEYAGNRGFHDEKLAWGDEVRVDLDKEVLFADMRVLLSRSFPGCAFKIGVE
jgi:hypothetical protein